MKYAIILDTETTGLDVVYDRVVELAVVVVCLRTGAYLAVQSDAVRAILPANHVSGLSTEMLDAAPFVFPPLGVLDRFDPAQTVVVAHNADFDRSFVEKSNHADSRLLTYPWVCSYRDIWWPEPVRLGSLVTMALDAGVPVVTAHRALADCMLLASLLRWAHGRGTDLVRMMEAAQTPPVRLAVNEPYDEERNRRLRSAGFRWDALMRVWSRSCPQANVPHVLAAIQPTKPSMTFSTPANPVP